MLEFLSHQVAAVSIEDVASHLALRENETDVVQCDRILTELYHNHLPRLDDSGLVRFDRERKTVNGLPTLDRLRPYLDPADESS